MHEWLIKRVLVPLKKQDLIMTVENCILVHQACHEKDGQTKAFRKRCLWQAARTVGASRIGPWYHELVTEKPTFLPKGLLVPRKATRGYVLLEALKLGAELANINLPNEWQDHEAIGPAIKAFRGHKAKSVEMENIPHGRLVELMIEGYWFQYLEGVTS